MKKTFRISLLLILVLTTFDSFGQTKDTSKKDNLVVYGDGFMFSVKEPTGWIGDIDVAKEYSANIVFYKTKSDLKSVGTLIQAYNFGKQDEKTEKDLEYDVKGYQDKYKSLKQQDLVVNHKDYKCFSKLVYVEGSFYQYIVYVNPGSKYKSGVSIAMNISKRQATEEELNAFKQIVASLIMFKG